MPTKKWSKLLMSGQAYTTLFRFLYHTHHCSIWDSLFTTLLLHTMLYLVPQVFKIMPDPGRKGIAPGRSLLLDPKWTGMANGQRGSNPKDCNPVLGEGVLPTSWLFRIFWHHLYSLSWKMIFELDWNGFWWHLEKAGEALGVRERLGGLVWGMIELLVI